MYNGLTTADKPALMDAKARGAEWVARDENQAVNGWKEKPSKQCYAWRDGEVYFYIGCGDTLRFIRWSDTEPVNIDLAFAQIAEMENKQNAKEHEQSAQEILDEYFAEQDKKPLTWNERINQMTVDEKVTLFQHDDCFIYKLTGTAYCDRHLGCEECTKQFLNSPYTEGETK